MARIARSDILARFNAMKARGEPIIGAGAGTGISAKGEEKGGADLIVIYNSGRYRMAGRGSLAGLMPYGDANGVVVDMAREVLPVVKHTPVLAGVCATDPFRQMDLFLDEIARLGFSGVQNFPTVGLIDGRFRANLEETDMGYAREVEMIALARARDLLTTPYVFDASEAAAMARAGADIVVCHFGLTVGGSIGAATRDAARRLPGADRRHGASRAGRKPERHRPRARRPARRAGGRRIRTQARAALPWLLRRLVDGAAAGRAGALPAGREIQRAQQDLTLKKSGPRRTEGPPGG